MRKMKVLSVLIVFMLIVPLLSVTIRKSYEAKAAGNIDVSSLRGINHAHTWYADRLDEALQGIKSWGANSVRIVLSNGYRWTKNSPSDVANVISKCEQLGFTAVVLEVHDTTGYGEEGGACSLGDTVAYWKELQGVLTGKEDFVIINIGNEPYGNNNYANWVQDTIEVIKDLRTAGFTHTIMVDAPNWGQDWASVMKNNALSVYDADPNKNIVFSIHMYGVYNTPEKVREYFQAFKDMDLPLVVGEFGHFHSDGDPDEEAIVNYAKQYGIGYFGWSWCGNSGGVEYLDMVNNWDPKLPTSWGAWFKTNALADGLIPPEEPGHDAEYTVINLPFSYDGAGEFYWKTNKFSTNTNDWTRCINSWNIELLEINGVDYTNKWSAQHQIPPSSDGHWYIHYKASVPWAHVEIK